jgi:hypothetical protein
MSGESELSIIAVTHGRTSKLIWFNLMFRIEGIAAAPSYGSHSSSHSCRLAMFRMFSVNGVGLETATLWASSPSIKPTAIPWATTHAASIASLDIMFAVGSEYDAPLPQAPFLRLINLAASTSPARHVRSMAQSAHKQWKLATLRVTCMSSFYHCREPDEGQI